MSIYIEKTHNRIQSLYITDGFQLLLHILLLLYIYLKYKEIGFQYKKKKRKKVKFKIILVFMNSELPKGVNVFVKYWFHIFIPRFLEQSWNVTPPSMQKSYKKLQFVIEYLSSLASDSIRHLNFLQNNSLYVLYYNLRIYTTLVFLLMCGKLYPEKKGKRKKEKKKRKRFEQ